MFIKILIALFLAFWGTFFSLSFSYKTIHRKICQYIVIPLPAIVIIDIFMFIIWFSLYQYCFVMNIYLLLSIIVYMIAIRCIFTKFLVTRFKTALISVSIMLCFILIGASAQETLDFQVVCSHLSTEIDKMQESASVSFDMIHLQEKGIDIKGFSRPILTNGYHISTGYTRDHVKCILYQPEHSNSGADVIQLDTYDGDLCFAGDPPTELRKEYNTYGTRLISFHPIIGADGVLYMIFVQCEKDSFFGSYGIKEYLYYDIQKGDFYDGSIESILS